MYVSTYVKKDTCPYIYIKIYPVYNIYTRPNCIDCISQVLQYYIQIYILCDGSFYGMCMYICICICMYVTKCTDENANY